MVVVSAYRPRRVGLDLHDGQINTSCHRLATDATLQCGPGAKCGDRLGRLATETVLTRTKICLFCL